MSSTITEAEFVELDKKVTAWNNLAKGYTWALEEYNQSELINELKEVLPNEDLISDLEYWTNDLSSRVKLTDKALKSLNINEMNLLLTQQYEEIG